jgi:hypothetical protein
VQPLRPAAAPEAGLVQVLDRRGLDQRAYGVGEPLGAPGAGPAHPGDGRSHQPDAEQVGHRLGQPVLGQKLVVQQVDHDRQEARAILHRGRDPLGKQRPGFPAAPAAAAAIRPMLGDDQRLRLGQIEHLARAAPRGHRRRQRQTTGPTGLGVVIDGDVRSGDLAQGLTFVALLPAGRFAGRLAQTAGARFPLRLVQPVAGRRLTAVGTVQPQPTLQLRHPRQQHRDGLLERCVLRPKPCILLRQRRRGGDLIGGGSAGSVLGRSHG